MLLRNKPNLVIVGAQKSGTTSLFDYLSLHPDIHPATPFKESGFFFPFVLSKKILAGHGHNFKSKRQLLRKGILEGYSNEKYILDGSTYYTIGDNYTKYNMTKKLNGVKKIYILRDPIERIKSNYIHEIERKELDISFSKFLENDIHIKTSSYDRILKFLDNKDSLVLQYEQLVSNPQEVVDMCSRFLNIDSIELKRDVKSNPSSKDYEIKTDFSNEKIIELLKNNKKILNHKNINKDLWKNF